MKKYEIVIVGGGVSGSVAAIACARLKKKVLLIDRNSYLGGMLTAAGVGPMMTFHDGDKQIIKGITGEVIDELVAEGSSPGHILDMLGYTSTITPFDTEAFKMILERKVLENGGEILYDTFVGSVETANNQVVSITTCNKDGLNKVYADVFIDATGDADIFHWSNAGTTCTDYQPMTMNVKVYGANVDKFKEFIRSHPEEFPRRKDLSVIDKAPRLSIGGMNLSWQKAVEAGEITFSRGGILIFETNNEGEFIINTSRIPNKIPTNAKELSEAETIGRLQVKEIVNFMRKYAPGFENIKVAYSGPSIGVRSSRQIVGKYTLTVDDILDATKFDDAIAHSAYPIDIHGTGSRKDVNRHLEPGKYYSIPYRSLQSVKYTNLLAVGRCISATFEAQAAIRTTPTVGAIGHAGGVAAALACENHNNTDVDVKQLQTILKQQNAYLE